MPDVPAGGYVLRFQPALPISPRAVKSVNFYLTTSVSFQDLATSIWDYELKKWVSISVTGNYTSISEPYRYVGPDGETRIKITNAGNNRAEINGSYISLVVEP